MADISLFDYALDACGSEIKDLGEVANISRRDFDDHGTFRFCSQVPAMEYVSLLIENLLMLRTARGGRVYAGFERMSRMEPITDRYLRIADLSERVYVFGEPDWQPPRHPNMQPVPVATGTSLAREWFVVVDAPKLHVALIAIDESGWTTPVLEERTFSAFVTHDDSIVHRLADAAEAFIDSAAPANV